MYAPIPTQSSFSVSSGPAVPPRIVLTTGSWSRVQAVLALGAAAVVSLCASALWDSTDDALAQDLAAFQQRVSVVADAAPGVAAPEALARRYLGALSPEQRLQISQQVSAEQSAGSTAAGNDAFVMRRLALYEEALQRTGGR